jgi:hypothetical protein
LKKILVKEDKDILCFWLLAYGFFYAYFHIAPPFLKDVLKSPLTWGDTLDFLTPFAVIPLAYILYARAYKIAHSLQPQQSSNRVLRILPKVLLAVGFLLYVDGHGLHLSSNSIARLLHHMKESELYKSVYLFDEIISHFIWDGGVLLISVALIIAAYKISFKYLTWENFAFLSLGATFYGLSFTANGIEGQTVIFTFPAAGAVFLLTLLLYFKRKKESNQNPFIFFFMSGYLLSLILFAYWGISRSGFPQFSELGWI